MNSYRRTLAITAIISTLSIPVLAQSASDPGSQNKETFTDPSIASEAAQMVPAKAILTRTLDADKDQPNSTIEASLRGKVTLSDGTVLPSNTVLIGEITRDDVQQAGTSELALRFNQAQLKNGKTVPIKATIVEMMAPGADADAPNDWTDQMLEVNQIDVVSGVDLHSKIASDNSGIFVSTKKHDVKVPDGSELQLAIGPTGGASMPTS